MREGMLPVTERVSRSTLALPFFVGLADEDVDLRLRLAARGDRDAV